MYMCRDGKIALIYCVFCTHTHTHTHTQVFYREGSRMRQNFCIVWRETLGMIA